MPIRAAGSWMPLTADEWRPIIPFCAAGRPEGGRGCLVQACPRAPPWTMASAFTDAWAYRAPDKSVLFYIVAAWIVRGERPAGRKADCPGLVL